MGLKFYLSLALIFFLAATTGADLIARTAIAREPFEAALREHLYYYAGVQIVGTLILLTPFLAVAHLCARMEKKARRRTAVPIFTAAMFTLLYFYFQGHQAAQNALLDEKWTASTLAVGMLPLFPGVPVVLAVLAAGALASKWDPRASGDK